MRDVDLSQNHRLARLERLTRDLRRARTFDDTLRVTRRAFDADDRGTVSMMLLSTRGLCPGQYRIVYADLGDAGPAGPPGGAWAPGGADAVWSGGVLSAVVGRPEVRLIHDVDWSTDPHRYIRRALESYPSVMAIPLAGERLPIDWAVLLKRRPDPFTVGQVEAAVERATLIGAMLDNQAIAADLARANRRLDADAREVGELQRSMLPAAPPRVAGLEVAAVYEPAARAGGDLYDFFPLDGDESDAARWCVFVGDVAGHGLATAVVMAVVQAVLHAHGAGDARPADLLSHANRQLCGRGLGGFVTAFLGVYEPAARRLTYAGAGHPPPLVRRAADRAVRPLDDVGSYPLGIDEAETFEEASVRFNRGDTVLLYTDGITEARRRRRRRPRSSDGHHAADDDQFGPGRLARLLSADADPPAELVARLRRAVLAYADGVPAADDQTLVAARVL